ncbi:hypothetical protein GGF37_007501 [Kickxella alabastrina]|nr:hypothetical protein GGF37_007501 [Kickxella alabastrina]
MAANPRISRSHILAILLSALYLVAIVNEWHSLKYSLKPTVTLLIAYPTSKPPIPRKIFHGLLFSTLGDIFLMLPLDQTFIPGLVSFLIAHILYIQAFGKPRRVIWWMAAPYALFAAVMLGLLSSGVGKEGWVVQVGVVVYVGVICFMAFCALMTGRIILVVGTVLFCVSDSVLAWNKFLQVYAWGEFVVMLTYYAAQLCIALGHC